MTNEQQYLQEIKQQMDACLKNLSDLDQDEPVDQETYDIIKKTVDQEDILRKKYEIGARFNVIRTQLASLLTEVEEHVRINLPKTPVPTETIVDTTTTLIYVSLFNFQGDKLNTWGKLLNAQALFDHSVNRPIYSSQEDIDTMLRSKANKNQQAYIEVRIKKDDILTTDSVNAFTDPFGYPLLRIKQGALKVENIQAFFYMSKKYRVGSDGSLTLID